MKSKHRSKRNSRFPKGLFVLLSLAVGLSFAAAGWVHAAPPIQYKEPRPKKDQKLIENGTSYYYNPENKTDPFASFITERERRLKELEDERKKKFELIGKRKAMIEELKKAKTELQKIDISQLTITGFVKTKDETFAMVTDPKGLGYVLTKGTPIGRNGGEVDNIVREDRDTEFGKEFFRAVIVKEPYLDDEGNIKYKFIEMSMAPYLIE
ncbi:MAG: pilus assembly protein PilP [Deltaproteobacteria bacterium]|nr:pilus assembly protein PilP [Deltaproteobacteria bacterium]